MLRAVSFLAPSNQKWYFEKEDGIKKGRRELFTK
jgi:hypothetical protein